MRSPEHLDEEWARLDAWTEDRHQTLRLSLKDFDLKLKELRSTLRKTNHKADKLKLRKQIMAQEKARTKALHDQDVAARELETEKEKHLNALQAHMAIKVETTEVFSVEWKVAFPTGFKGNDLP